MLELDLTTRHDHHRFLGHASAVTQAEIRRLRRFNQFPPEPAHDTIETVQRELQRLSAFPPRAAGRTGDVRRIADRL
jgi:hypothetical protein